MTYKLNDVECYLGALGHNNLELCTLDAVALWGGYEMNIYTNDGSLYIVNGKEAEFSVTKFTQPEGPWKEDGEPFMVNSISITVGEASYLGGAYIGIVQKVT